MSRLSDLHKRLKAAEKPGDPDGAYLLCMRPEHMWTYPVEGAKIGSCSLCNHPIWISPSSRDVEKVTLGRGGAVYFVCCECSECHEPADYKRLSFLLGPAHTHHWQEDGKCECGMDRSVFRRELRLD
jgi:hypothetical protein